MKMNVWIERKTEEFEMTELEFEDTDVDESTYLVQMCAECESKHYIERYVRRSMTGR